MFRVQGSGFKVLLPWGVFGFADGVLPGPFFALRATKARRLDGTLSWALLRALGLGGKVLVWGWALG